MSRTMCPSCGLGFDNHREGGLATLRGKLLFGPERLVGKSRLDSAARDLCPNCGHRFVSSEFEAMRDLSRRKLGAMGVIYGVVTLIIACLVVLVWHG